MSFLGASLPFVPPPPPPPPPHKLDEQENRWSTCDIEGCERPHPVLCRSSNGKLVAREKQRSAFAELNDYIVGENKNSTGNTLHIVGLFRSSSTDAQIRSHLPTLKKLVDATVHIACQKTKASREQTKQGQMLFAPTEINAAFKQALAEWNPVAISCGSVSHNYYINGFAWAERAGTREMDFVYNHVGVEVQFGKYPYMVYDVYSKMPIFRKAKIIDFGVEIVPVKAMAAHMSSGIGTFEQFMFDLEQRVVSDNDIPALIFGVCPANLRPFRLQ